MNNRYNKTSEIIDKYVSDDLRKIIGDFTILWNLYEKNLLSKSNKKFQEQKHEDLLIIIRNEYEKLDITKKNQIEYEINDNISRLKIFLENNYIYFNGENIITFFHILDNINAKNEVIRLFKSGDNKEVINWDFYDKIRLLMIITYRIRNNMFHGSKKILTLEDEKELFIICNNVLSILLNNIEDRIILYGRRTF